MCPGGCVVNASSEDKRLAVNGMSYSAGDGKNANSAIVTTITPNDFESKHPLAGMYLQRELEEKAFNEGMEHLGTFSQQLARLKNVPARKPDATNKEYKSRLQRWQSQARIEYTSQNDIV